MTPVLQKPYNYTDACFLVCCFSYLAWEEEKEKRRKITGRELNGKELLDRTKWLNDSEIPTQAKDRKTDQIPGTIA